MADAADLVAALRARGLSIVAVDGRLDVSPADRLTDDERVAIRATKPALLILLAAEQGLPRRMCTTVGTVRAPGTDFPAEMDPAGSLPPVHDAADPWVKPTAPCMVCGQVAWRVWCHDEAHIWQWICNGCRPLVVHNPDGTEWRA